ncbi:hypothetical protein WL51_29500 [Burkholderia ubonensis]|nr:hypothetical protein WL51_29500 [Burkholderia ubonensis]
MIRLDAVRLARLDQGVQVGAGLRAGNRIREQPVLAADGKLAFILPLSGKKLKSIIVGIRCMVTASRFEMSSNAAAAAWCMSTPALA